MRLYSEIAEQTGDRYDFLTAGYVEDKSKGAWVMSELHTLPLYYQVILLAHYYMSFNDDEIAYVLETSPLEAALALKRAKEMFKGKIEKAVGKVLDYMPIPEGEEPILTQLYKLDADATVTSEFVRRIVLYTQNRIESRGEEERFEYPF